MSFITILGGDWRIDFDDEVVGANAVAGLKMVRPNVASPTIRSSNALYSAVADAMDELNAMDDENPMLPTTPQAYTMENEYFMPRRGTQFLTGGAISSVNWTNNILCKEVSGGTDFVDGDVGRQVTESASGDTGTLLDYETLPDGTDVIWIRPDDPTPVTGDIFDSATGTVSVTGDSGTGSRNATAAANTGEVLFPNFQVIGSVPTATDVYVVQDRLKIGSWDDVNTQFWATDTTASLGIIDILLRVNDPSQAGFPEIAEGVVEVFGRRYGSLYDNFALDIGGGGRSALPLASSPDINNVTGYIRFTTDAGALTPAVGDVLQEVGTPQHRIVITAISGTGPNYTIDAYRVGLDLSAWADNDVIEDIGQTATLTLSSAESATPGGPTDTGAGEGGTVTVNFGFAQADHDGDGNNEDYSITVDAQGDVPQAKVYERIKYLCRRGAGDPFDTPLGQDGEQYRGLQLRVNYDGQTGSELAEGDNIENFTQNPGLTSAQLLANQTTADYLTLTDISGTFADDDELRDETGAADHVDIDGSPITIAPVKASPFGTSTGSQIFGAPGVLFLNPAPADIQNYILTDNLINLRTPPNTVSVSIASLIAGDVGFMARDTGVAGIIDKDQNGGLTAPAGLNNGQSDTQVEVANAIDSETPASSTVRIVDTSTTSSNEHRYRYASFSGQIFTLVVPTAATGSHDGANNDTDSLDDAGQLFSSGAVPVVVGDLVRNTTKDEVWEVTSVADGSLGVKPFVGVSNPGTDWDNGDAYEINALIQNYDASDNMYVPLIDGVATGSVLSNSLVKTPAANFGVVINVRRGKVILPFSQNATVTDNGLASSAIRTPDTIAT